nr:unnamed protein product [Callosobruchus chinensis]
MPYFVINGEPHCPNYAHALVVAQYLCEKLPNFIYKKIEKDGMEWAEYVNNLNKQNKWYIARGPIVWKEINMWGGRKYLIGGLESIIPRSDLQKLASDNLKFYEENNERSAHKHKEKDVRNITVFGRGCLENNFLLTELLQVPGLSKSRGIHFKLFDGHCVDSEKYKELLQDNAEYINEQRIFGSRDIVTIAKDEIDAVEDCDVLIYLENCSKRIAITSVTILIPQLLQKDAATRRHDQSRGQKDPADNPEQPGPRLFHGHLSRGHLYQDQAVEHRGGDRAQGPAFRSAGLRKDGSAGQQDERSPVWGFVGLHYFVDSRNIVFKADMLRPYERALKAPPGSTLALGTIKSELRKISYMLTADEEELTKKVENRKTTIEMRLERPTTIGNIRALISLIRLWFSPKRSDEIISLGVCSDHSFQIPAGVVFSQPVMLDQRGKWAPYSKFPLISDDTRKHIEQSIKVSNRVLDKFNIFKAKEEDILQYKLYDYSVEQGG